MWVVWQQVTMYWLTWHYHVKDIAGHRRHVKSISLQSTQFIAEYNCERVIAAHVNVKLCIGCRRQSVCGLSITDGLSCGHISNAKQDRPIVIIERSKEVGIADFVATFRSSQMPPGWGNCPQGGATAPSPESTVDPSPLCHWFALIGMAAGPAFYCSGDILVKIALHLL